MESTNGALYIPLYDSISSCELECVSLTSYCVSTHAGTVCQLNIFVFLAIIFAAVFTGVIIPLSCVLCYVFKVCKRVKRRFRAGDEENRKLSPSKNQPSVSDSEAQFHSNTNAAKIRSEVMMASSRHLPPVLKAAKPHNQKHIHWKSTGSVA